jgi:hypothetical protein
MAEHEKQWTFEEIDQHIKSANLAQFEQGGASHFTAAAVAANPADVLKRICAIYKVIRPILVVLSTFPFIPASWKAAIKTFMSLMDTLCPNELVGDRRWPCEATAGSEHDPPTGTCRPSHRR